MTSIPPNPKRVGYIDPIHVPLDVSLYMGSHIHQHLPLIKLYLNDYTVVINTKNLCASIFGGISNFHITDPMVFVKM